MSGKVTGVKTNNVEVPGLSGTPVALNPPLVSIHDKLALVNRTLSVVYLMLRNAGSAGPSNTDLNSINGYQYTVPPESTVELDINNTVTVWAIASLPCTLTVVNNVQTI